MMRSGEGDATEAAGREDAAEEGRRHLVTVDPVRGRLAWEHAWCTCGAEADFRIDGHAEDWALSHPGEPLALGGWRATRAS